MPARVVTGGALLAANENATSVGPSGTVGTSVTTKHAGRPGEMSTATLSRPTTALVAQSVALKVRDAWPWSDASAMPAPRAGLLPALMMVAKNVAAAPTATARLEGSTEATSVVGGGGAKASPFAVWSTAPRIVTTPPGLIFMKFPRMSAARKNACEWASAVISSDSSPDSATGDTPLVCRSTVSKMRSTFRAPAPEAW